MLVSDRFLAGLLDGGDVSLVQVQFDSQFAPANNSLYCYKKPNTGG